MKKNTYKNKNELSKLIYPLLLEQLLVVLTGAINTIMISKVGEAAVSAVSLVDMLNFLIITIFMGLSTGGSILSSRFVGENKKNMIPKVFSHLLILVISCSLLFMVIGLIGNVSLLKFVFGAIETDVLMNANQYLKIIVCSFPFLSIYSSSTAILRGLGKFKISMAISFVMNLLNIIGNYILVYHLHLGILGVAIPTLFARGIAALISFLLAKRQMNIPIKIGLTKLNKKLMKDMLNISVPGCIELSIFQLGKIIVLGLVARLGTNAIAANAIGNMINNVQALPEDAISIALLTLVSKNLGCNNLEGAKEYVKKLMKLIYHFMIVLNIVIFLSAGFIAQVFALSPETNEMTINIIRFNCIFAITVWPLAFALPNALKGATDVKYLLIVSLSSMWIFRVGLSYLVITILPGNIYLLYICFAVDWVVRAAMFLGRYMSGKWYFIYKKNTQGATF